MSWLSKAFHAASNPLQALQNPNPVAGIKQGWQGARQMADNVGSDVRKAWDVAQPMIKGAGDQLGQGLRQIGRGELPTAPSLHQAGQQLGRDWHGLGQMTHSGLDALGRDVRLGGNELKQGMEQGNLPGPFNPQGGQGGPGAPGMAGRFRMPGMGGPGMGMPQGMGQGPGAPPGGSKGGPRMPGMGGPGGGMPGAPSYGMPPGMPPQAFTPQGAATQPTGGAGMPPGFSKGAPMMNPQMLAQAQAQAIRGIQPQQAGQGQNF